MDYLIKETGKHNFVHIGFVNIKKYFLVEAAAYLIDLMHDKNAEIRRVCDSTLDIISVNIFILVYVVYECRGFRII